MTSNKQYGLILPKKQQQTPRLGNVFGDDNVSDDDDSTDWVKKALRAGEKHKMKKQTKLDIQKALNEDPTIYQYDEVYDDLERTRCQSEVNKHKVKKPKYIQNLLKTAEQRKKEQEHRIERIVQKEREAEGEMYADKESFVTSAYRAKLEEFKQMEEEEARMSRLEAIADVTKQQDMSGFYRHLYKQTVDSQNNTDECESSEMKTNMEQTEEKTPTNNTSGEKDNLAESKTTNNTDTKLKGITKSKARQYRQRTIDTCDSDSESETSKKKVKSDQPVLSSENKDINKSEIQELKAKEDVQDRHDVNTDKSSTDIVKNVNTTDTENKESNVATAVEISQDQEIVDPENKKEKLFEKKDKTSIYAKRTIGPLFEAALQRYYARKAKKLAEMHQI